MKMAFILMMAAGALFGWFVAAPAIDHHIASVCRKVKTQ